MAVSADRAVLRRSASSSRATAGRAEIVALPRRAGALPSEPVLDDGELADGLVAGEPWAATATYRKHARMVYRFLDRALGPAGDAEDLTQEVFVRVFSKARGLRDRNALRSFLLSFAIRVLKGELRRQRVRRLFRLANVDPFPEPTAPAVDAESRQALRRLYAILQHLTLQERSAFVLRHIEGMSLDEVAAALGVSLATAKRRLARAGEWVSKAADREPSLGHYRSRDSK